jgi:hypothetical protein
MTRAQKEWAARAYFPLAWGIVMRAMRRTERGRALLRREPHAIWMIVDDALAGAVKSYRKRHHVKLSTWIAQHAEWRAREVLRPRGNRRRDWYVSHRRTLPDADPPHDPIREIERVPSWLAVDDPPEAGLVAEDWFTWLTAETPARLVALWRLMADGHTLESACHTIRLSKSRGCTLLGEARVALRSRHGLPAGVMDP